MSLPWHLPKSDTYFASILNKSPEGFELDHLEFALTHCHNFRVAVDGGAHIGTWSVALSKRFKTVYAFEPAQDTYDCLVQNLGVRGCRNVMAQNAALGNVFGMCKSVEDISREGNTGSRMVVPGMGYTRMVRVDDLQIPNIDFLKFDVEGYEIFALQGAEQTIKYQRPTVMVECKQFVPPRNGGIQVVKDYLNSIGYYEVGGVRNDRVFVPKYESLS